MIYLTEKELGDMGVEITPSILPALKRANLDIYRKTKLSQDAFNRLSAEDKTIVKMATMDQTLFLNHNGLESSFSKGGSFKIGSYSETGGGEESCAESVEEWLSLLSYKKRFASLSSVEWYGDL